MFNWLLTRSAGVLLHPTCFPGNQGVGVLDAAVVESFLDFLKRARLRYWQLCPLGPTGFGDSPYQCFSAFAGNPYLVDLEPLRAAGLLDAADLQGLAALPRTSVDFAALYALKWPLLFKAYARFREQHEAARAQGSVSPKANNPDEGGASRESAALAPSLPPLPYGDFTAFCQKHGAAWLESYGLFMALKDEFGGDPWWLWPRELRRFSSAKTSTLAQTEAVALRAEAYRFAQYLFFGQWQRVRERATERGIEIIGDVPIFVARDSADVWCAPELFKLDRETGEPTQVAGVPPDYFSADGQLWGNPLYDWPVHEVQDYAWWLARLRANLALCDVVRLDHFRAFDTYWAIPAGAENARGGAWQPGPGAAFFRAMKRALPDCRLIAEDLGELSDSVHALRRETGLPGMAILQFAFGSTADNFYLPHNLSANTVLYPGTHDNDTTLGWYAAADAVTQHHVREYFRVDGHAVNWDFVRAGYASVARLFVVPLQDLLGLGAEARFNTPGIAAGNWKWRYSEGQLAALTHQSADYLQELGALYART